MKKILKYLPIVLIIGLVSFTTPIAFRNTQVSGFFNGQKVETELDSEIASYYFRKQTGEHLPDSHLDSIINSAASTLSSNPFNNHDMALLSNKLSTDFATLYLIDELLKIDKNRSAQKLYNIYDKPANQIDEHKRVEFHKRAKEYLFVFVPGLFYLRHPETGGDFAAQRNQLEAMGLKTHLVKTNETGLVEENANIIANDIMSLSRTNKKIIIVSASKGGPDLAFALGHTLSQHEAKSVKAWISIGGVLRGSPVADNYLHGFKRLYAQFILFFIGEDIDFVEDLGSERSVKRHSSLTLPEDLLIIHFIGAPLSGQLNQEVENSYKQLSKLGPNDGLTTLVDELTPQGIAITELGLDHYYKHDHIDIKTISLIYTALELMEPQK